MDRQLILGLDVGTTGTKAILIDTEGHVVASHTEEYPLYTPQEGWAEQDPADWWDASVTCIRTILQKAAPKPGELKGIGLSGQMHGLVPLDAEGNVLRRSILWCDQRTTKQVEEVIQAAGGMEGLLSFTNNGMLTGYTGGKILWMRENEPELFQRMCIFLNPKDYLRYRLTGEQKTEVADASGVGFFDTKTRAWNEQLIGLLGLSMDIFPACVESDQITGGVTEEVAALTGLPVGLPVTGGGGDAVIQTTGMGLVEPGVMGVVLGTSGVVAMGLSEFSPNPEGKLQVFCGVAKNLWSAVGVTLAAGGSFRWFRDALCAPEKEEAQRQGRDVYELLSDSAATSPPGANKLLFLPYLIGERCPYPDPNARGGWIGLTLNHTKADITRSVMEGISYSLRQVGDLITRMMPGGHMRYVVASGGGAQSPLWRQILADLFNLPVRTLSGSGEGGAYAAALVAGVGVGLWDNLVEACKVLHVETETQPLPENVEKYRKLFAVYEHLYPQLKPVFDEMADI